MRCQVERSRNLLFETQKFSTLVYPERRRRARTDTRVILNVLKINKIKLNLV